MCLEKWERSTAYNLIRGAIMRARMRREKNTNVFLYTFSLYEGEEKFLADLGYTLTWMFCMCNVSWK